MHLTTKLLLLTIVLGLIDILIPVPIIGAIFIYVLLNKPHWFRRWIDEIYCDSNPGIH